MYRVGIDVPKVEVRYEHLSVDGDAYVGSRALPTLWNATLNTVEVIGFDSYCFLSPFIYTDSYSSEISR